jgi:HNH endonuclease
MRKEDPLARMFRRRQVDPATGCWNYTGSTFKFGYGKVKSQGKNHTAHTIAYKRLRGPVPEGMELDHVCRNPRCFNPDHLEPVTHRENMMRGNTVTGANAAKTHCHRGHELSGKNLFIRRDGRRRCRTCESETQRRIRATPEMRAKHAAYERQRRKEKRNNQK